MGFVSGVDLFLRLGVQNQDWGDKTRYYTDYTKMSCLHKHLYYLIKLQMVGHRL